MILNTKRIHNSFWRNLAARAKQTLSKVLFVAKKKRRPLRSSRAKIVKSLATVNELKIIIFVLNLYLTVFVYTKTIIHLSVGG